MLPIQRTQIVRSVYPSVNVHWYNATNNSLSMNSFNILSNEIQNQASFSTCTTFCLPHLFIYIWKFCIFYVQIFFTCCVENFLFHWAQFWMYYWFQLHKTLPISCLVRFFFSPNRIFYTIQRSCSILVLINLKFSSLSNIYGADNLKPLQY